MVAAWSTWRCSVFRPPAQRDGTPCVQATLDAAGLAPRRAVDVRADVVGRAGAGVLAVATDPDGRVGGGGAGSARSSGCSSRWGGCRRWRCRRDRPRRNVRPAPRSRGPCAAGPRRRRRSPCRCPIAWRGTPTMIGFFVASGTPTMTVGRLLFAALGFGYILVGVRLEEQDLMAELRSTPPYAAATPRFVPRLPPRATSPVPVGQGSLREQSAWDPAALSWAKDWVKVARNPETKVFAVARASRFSCGGKVQLTGGDAAPTTICARHLFAWFVPTALEAWARRHLRPGGGGAVTGLRAGAVARGKDSPPGVRQRLLETVSCAASGCPSRMLGDARAMDFFCYHRDRPGSMALRERLAEEHWSYMDRYAATMVARGPPSPATGR